MSIVLKGFTLPEIVNAIPGPLTSEQLSILINSGRFVVEVKNYEPTIEKGGSGLIPSIVSLIPSIVELEEE